MPLVNTSIANGRYKRDVR